MISEEKQILITRLQDHKKQYEKLKEDMLNLIIDNRKNKYTKSHITVLIKELAGTTFSMKVSPDDTVEFLMYYYQKHSGVPVNQQRMIFNGKRLDKERKISDYKMTSCCTIYFCLALRGGMFANENDRYDYIESESYQDSLISILSSQISQEEEFLSTLQAQLDEETEECDPHPPLLPPYH